MAFALPGGVNNPVVTAWAAVTVVSGSERAARRSHAVGVCAMGRPARPEIRISTTTEIDRAQFRGRMTGPPLRLCSSSLLPYTSRRSQLAHPCGLPPGPSVVATGTG